MTCSHCSCVARRRLFALPGVALWSVVLAGAASLAGCGGGGSTVGRVEGLVTLDGKPLPGAQVEFIPASGRPSLAETGTDGRYRLRYTMDQEGAIVGAHTVKIHTAVDGRVDRSEELVPARYHAKSELRADVKAGSNKFDFELKSK